MKCIPIFPVWFTRGQGLGLYARPGGRPPRSQWGTAAAMGPGAVRGAWGDAWDWGGGIYIYIIIDSSHVIYNITFLICIKQVMIGHRFRHKSGQNEISRHLFTICFSVCACSFNVYLVFSEKQKTNRIDKCTSFVKNCTFYYKLSFSKRRKPVALND